MVQFAIHHNAQSLKNPRRRMEMRTWRPFHYSLDHIDQSRGCGDRSHSAGAHQCAGKRARCAFFPQLMEDLPKFTLTCLVHDIRGTAALALIHAHIQRTRSEKAETTFPIFDL